MIKAGSAELAINTGRQLPVCPGCATAGDDVRWFGHGQTKSIALKKPDEGAYRAREHAALPAANLTAGAAPEGSVSAYPGCGKALGGSGIIAEHGPGSVVGWTLDPDQAYAYELFVGSV